MKNLTALFLVLSSCLSLAQNRIEADITTSTDLKSLTVNQSISFKNTGEKALSKIFLYDWIHAFSDKKSPLAKRYAQEYVRRFHFASDFERGGTEIKTLEVLNTRFYWNRVSGQPDLIEITIENELKPEESIDIELSYVLKIPDSKFTGFGWNQRELNLKYWLIEPAILNEDWVLYSHKDLNDYPSQQLDYKLHLEYPNTYSLISNFEEKTTETELVGFQKKILKGKGLVGPYLFIKRINNFETVQTDHVKIFTNLKDSDLRPEIEALIMDRIVYFLEERFGNFDFEKMLITQEDYNLSPIYGLNQLPSFIRPFPDGFQYDMKLLKTITDQYFRRSILTHTRDHQWFKDAIMVKVMMDYVDTYYPDVKLLGSFANVIGLRWMHASKLEFNDKYNFIHSTTIRQNLGQKINSPQDSLLKFNQKLSNPYKAGLGFKYLEDYLGEELVNMSLKLYFNSYKLKFSTPEDYFDILSSLTTKDISWFYSNYLGSSKDIDFKVKNVRILDDSLEIKLVNKTENPMPVALYQLRDGHVISKDWVSPFKKDTTVYRPNLESDRIAVNYEQIIPEVNPRNNFKSHNKLFNRPVQLRILEDIEDPNYNQLFITPEFNYNLYDGISLGPKLYNTSLLPKQFNFKLNPKYGLNSEAIVGGASLDYTQFFKDKNLFKVDYGISGVRFSYDQDLFYNRYSAFINMTYRPSDLRDNRRHNVFLRSVNVTQDENELVTTNEPNYNVFNLRYNFSNKNLDRFFTNSLDFQVSQKFSKMSSTLSFRQLYDNNRQINFRFFGGLFLHNNARDSDFFSFALDRPTDYLFDYNYYGRSEQSGLFSQQFIMAEGGFKSRFEQRFADDWIVSTNVSTTIWNWIFAYGDVGFYKNSFSNTQFVYDSGIRFSFVEDYFELYLPVYSSNGWEVGQPDYDQRIRFIVSLDFRTLLRLFTRKWY